VSYSSYEASVFQFLVLMFGGIYCVIAGVSWFLREAAELEDTVIYWLVSGREPYIGDADKRREHMEFKSKMSLALGIPLLLIGALTPASIFAEFGPVIAVPAILSLIFLHLIFIGDAADKSEEDRVSEEVETEKLLSDEESGRLHD